MKRLIVSFTCGALLIGGILFSNDVPQAVSAYEPSPTIIYNPR
ncbi:hypothetical protein [Virgibacillus pantothenticus]|nr:hypothetical protein [Virgibacillus pantothenticus]MEB5453718.1 hypothetical protein [Virgibacillus pantothenticus]MEB5457973.1 hypothetical protein [Virgibacillus pantothenticus]MEB5462138.1 hypothetical protein [Virgibacillus pantothenticus]MEB5466242.1 hypothetical protein [Virgibacillus pantothenticus]MEB5470556.1 hypothetical protein [Virgibacillus pantothenticus]